METICHVCGNEKKVIPAGTSRKTGKDYQAFSVCENCNPAKKQNAPAPQNAILDRIFKGVEAIYKKIDAIEAFLLRDKQQEKFEEELKNPELETPEEEAERKAQETAYEEIPEPAEKTDTPPF